jgi:hypothetical protein
MRPLPILLGIVLLAAGCGSSHSSAGTPTLTPGKALHASGPKTIQVIASTVPHTIRAGKAPGVLTITVKVTGVALDVQALGAAPKDSQGNIQAYLDRIPSVAYRKTDLRFPWLFQVASPLITFRLPPAVLHAKPGRHRLLLALARNNAVLYNLPPAIVRFTLR